MQKFLSKASSVLEDSFPALRVMYIAGGVLCFILVLFITTDVVLRYVFNRPLGGSIDITQVFVVAVVWLGVGWAQATKSHIKLDIFTDHLSSRNALALDIATYLLMIGVTVVFIWQGVENTLWFLHINKSSDVYAIPLAPFAALIPFGCALLLIVLVRDFLSKIVEALKLNFRGYMWPVILGTPILFMGLMFLCMQPVFSEILSPPVIGLIGIVVGFTLLFLGMPIGLCLAMTGFVFGGTILGISQGFSLVGGDLYFHTAKYDWSVIILFILMGAFIIQTNVGAEAYNTMHKWLGHLPGGLGVATIGACAALATVVGSPTPCVVTMSDIALPAMRKHNYSDKLASGTIVAGASLGPLIPPSVGFIMYGILAEVSIGSLFIAGIIPGLLLALGFILTVYLMCRMNSTLGPPSTSATWSARFSSLKGGGPIVVIFLLVLGGIFFGVFTAIEGGAIGAFAAFALGLIMKRLTFKKFTESLLYSGRLVSSILFMIVCALVFGRLLVASNLTHVLIDFISGIGLSPFIFVVVIVFLYFVLGFALDEGLMLVITVPILAPLAKALGIDMIWFGVLLIMMVNLGGYSPPYGICLFVFKSVSNIPMGTIFRGTIPFIITNAIIVALILFVPALATWLPDLMK